VDYLSDMFPVLRPIPRMVFLIHCILLSASVVAQSDPRTYQVCMDGCVTAENAGDHQKAYDYLQQAEELALAENDPVKVGKVYLKRGEILMRLGEYSVALDLFYKALSRFSKVGEQEGMASAYNDVGAIHHYDKNYQKALEYYKRSMQIRRSMGNDRTVAQLLNNFGTVFEDMGEVDSAMFYHRRSLAIWERLQDISWMSVCLSNIGSCQTRSGNEDSARYFLQRSMQLMPPSKDRNQYAYVAGLMGATYLARGPWERALHWCGESLRTAEEMQQMFVVQQQCECLYKAYDRLGDAPKALAMLKRSVSVRDSLFGQEHAKELTRIDLTHTFEEQQFADSLVEDDRRRTAELEYRTGLAREREQRNVFLFSAVGVVVLALGLWNRLRYVRRSQATLLHEQERSERLLLNILPHHVAEELKDGGEAKARDVDGVSILFTDFQDFSDHSAKMSAQELVALLNAYYTAFDAIVTRYGLEKIKTIGDSYMAAGGLGAPSENSAMDTVNAALDLQAFVQGEILDRAQTGHPSWSMRVGVHTGPVVAGIVGKHKFQYDIWGDTVNVASRMESSGAVGLVNISADTYRRVKDLPGVRFTERGLINVKGRSAIGMYFVERVR